MSEQNSPTPSSPPCNPIFTSGSVTLSLDAPLAPLSASPLPPNFRSMQGIPNISGAAASGSAQYSYSQLQTLIKDKHVTTPLVIVDLRQEPHGFLTLSPNLNDETEIAVGWFAERDWLNVGKGRPSIVVDENNRLNAAAETDDLVVNLITAKVATEDGICTATPITVYPTGTYRDEQSLTQTLPDVGYFRLPSTDHCRPRDSEVDEFVVFETNLPSNTWLHFHCRAGDGRTTSFMVMHDIIHNAPNDSLSTILTRQGPAKGGGINGIDLGSMPTDPTIFSFPFSQERVTFIKHFYSYVCDAKPGGFKLTWSDWVPHNLRNER